MGTNPLSLVPAPYQDPPAGDWIWRTSTVALGKLILAQKLGKSIPEGWALDKDGNPTTDPAEGRKGMLTPFGGPKGSGIAIMIDIASGILSGGGPSATTCTGLYEMDWPAGRRPSSWAPSTLRTSSNRADVQGTGSCRHVTRRSRR